MRGCFRLFLLGVFFTSLSYSAIAETTDDDMCRNGLFPSQLKTMRLATFAGNAQSRLYFFDDMNGCPSAGAQCQSKSYVVPGDELIVGKEHGDWSCVWYPGKVHETVGWVSHQQLRFAAPDEHPNWSGTWKQYAYPGYINIARESEEVYVLGNMKWTGAELPDGSHVEHFGELEGKMTIQGAHGRIGDFASKANGCAAEFTRIGNFMVVHDNAQCGGMNVRFDGVYAVSTHKK